MHWLAIVNRARVQAVSRPPDFNVTEPTFSSSFFSRFFLFLNKHEKKE